MSNWYCHRFRPRVATKLVIKQLIDGLASASSIRAPRKRQVRKVYYELFWEKKLKSSFDEFWAHSKSNHPNPEANIVAARNQFIMKCYDNESADVKGQILDHVESDYKQEMAKWKEGALVTNTVNGYQKYTGILFLQSKKSNEKMLIALGRWQMMFCLDFQML